MSLCGRLKRPNHHDWSRLDFLSRSQPLLENSGTWARRKDSFPGSASGKEG
ncbi:hypothetical protein AVEN_62303-1, partial [Araneus ventricosus]